MTIGDTDIGARCARPACCPNVNVRRCIWARFARPIRGTEGVVAIYSPFAVFYFPYISPIIVSTCPFVE